MNGSYRDRDRIKTQLEEIRLLEEKVAQMKRTLLESATSILEGPESEGETLSFLVLRVLDRLFAIPVAFVDEVFEMVLVTPLAERKTGVIGLIDYHGELLVLFDLSEIGGMGRGTIQPDNIIVVCTIYQFRFGLMVQEASDVVTVSRDHITTADEVMAGILKEIGFIQADQESIAIVDLWSAVLSIQLDDVPESARKSIMQDAMTQESDP